MESGDVPSLLYQNIGKLLDINSQQAARIEQLKEVIWRHGLEVPAAKRSAAAADLSDGTAEQEPDPKRSRQNVDEMSVPRFSRLSRASWVLHFDPTAQGSESNSDFRNAVVQVDPRELKNSGKEQSSFVPDATENTFQLAHAPEQSAQEEQNIPDESEMHTENSTLELHRFQPHHSGKYRKAQFVSRDATLESLNKSDGFANSSQNVHSPDDVSNRSTISKSSSPRRQPSSGPADEPSVIVTVQGSLGVSNDLDREASRELSEPPSASSRDFVTSVTDTERGTSEYVDTTAATAAPNSEETAQLSDHDADGTEVMPQESIPEAANQEDQPLLSNSDFDQRSAPQNDEMQKRPGTSERSRVSFILPHSPRAKSPSIGWRPRFESSPLKSLVTPASSLTATTPRPTSSHSSYSEVSTAPSLAPASAPASAPTVPATHTTFPPQRPIRMRLSERLSYFSARDSLSSPSQVNFSARGDPSSSSISVSGFEPQAATSSLPTTINGAAATASRGPIEAGSTPAESTVTQLQSNGSTTVENEIGGPEIAAADAAAEADRGRVLPKRHRIVRKVYDTEGDATLPTVDPVRGEPADVSSIQTPMRI